MQNADPPLPKAFGSLWWWVPTPACQWEENLRSEFSSSPIWDRQPHQGVPVKVVPAEQTCAQSVRQPLVAWHFGINFRAKRRWMKGMSTHIYIHWNHWLDVFHKIPKVTWQASRNDSSRPASELPVQGARGSSNTTSDTREVLALDSMINFWTQQRKEDRTKGTRISEVKMFVPRQSANEESMRWENRQFLFPWKASQWFLEGQLSWSALWDLQILQMI